MKRLAVFLCVLAFALSFPVAAGSQPAFTPIVSLSEDGTTITVTVNVEEGGTVCGATLDFAYDPELVSCQSVTGGSALSGSTFVGNADYDTGVARAAWMGLTPLSGDGTVAVITFKVLSAAEGKTAFFSVTEASAYNELGGNLSVTGGSASLSIPKAPGAGDGGSGETTPTVPPTPSAPSVNPSKPPAHTPEKEPEDDPEVFLMAFTDVAESAYYYDAVRWAVAQGITTGTSDTTFSPNASCNRAQTVTFLWRAAGCPEPTLDSCPFTDVAENAYYYDAVLWAVEQGITTGTSDTTFSPNAQVTRSQVVTFLWRTEGYYLPISEDCPFTDVSGSAYYSNAVLWALEQGITTGTSATTFSPDSSCIRAQIVTFLYRSFME